MIESYSTIKIKSNSEITEKKSRFIAIIFPIATEDEALKEIESIKKEYRDAKHYVYAYRFIEGIEKCTDDGEPSGTAGVPILQIIQKENLHNVLVVVVRYFGGTLLGTGGLVRAYTNATKEALKTAKKIRLNLCETYIVDTDYIFYNILKDFFIKNDIYILNEDFTDNIKLEIAIQAKSVESIINNIISVTNGKVRCTKQNQGYYEEK